MNCVSCGKEIPDKAVFCPNCGTLTAKAAKPSTLSRTTASITDKSRRLFIAGLAIGGLVFLVLVLSNLLIFRQPEMVEDTQNIFDAPRTEATYIVMETQGSEITPGEDVEVFVEDEPTRDTSSYGIEDELTPSQSTEVVPHTHTKLTVTSISEIQLEGVEIVPIVENIMLSPDGSRIAYSDLKQLCVYTTTGERESCISIEDKLADPGSLSWSPDSKNIVFTERAFTYRIDSDIWLLHVEDNVLENLTDDGYEGQVERSFPIDHAPTWIDGRNSLAFFRWLGGRETYSVLVLGPSTGEATELFQVPISTCCIKQSPDGRIFTYIDSHPSRAGVYIRDVERGETIQILEERNIGEVAFSADSQYLVALPDLSQADSSPVIIPISASENTSTILTNDSGFPIRSFGWALNGAAFIYNLGIPGDSGLYFATQPGNPAEEIFRSFLIGAPSLYPFRLIPIAQNNTFLITQTSEGAASLALVTLGEE